jgi:hypothetical protein
VSKRVVTLVNTGPCWELRLSWIAGGFCEFYFYEFAIEAALYAADSEAAELWT